jgi:hypothetical protein
MLQGTAGDSDTAFLVGGIIDIPSHCVAYFLVSVIVSGSFLRLYFAFTLALHVAAIVISGTPPLS